MQDEASELNDKLAAVRAEEEASADKRCKKLEDDLEAERVLKSENEAEIRTLTADLSQKTRDAHQLEEQVCSSPRTGD